MSQLLSVRGGRRLEGEVTIQGAKNSVLPILAATLLARGQVALLGCPRPQYGKAVPRGEGNIIHGAAVKPDVAVRPGLHLLGHIFQRRDPHLFPPGHQKLNVDILAVGLGGVVVRLGLIGLEEKEEIVPVHLVALVLQLGEVGVSENLQGAIHAGVDTLIKFNVLQAVIQHIVHSFSAPCAALRQE